MIIAERKPIQEIKKMIVPYKKILIVGCATCVTICMAGGKPEVKTLSSILKLSYRIDGKDIEVIEDEVERQCEKEFVETLEENIKNVDAVISLGCGAGVQVITKMFPKTVVLPGLNTKFIGIPQEHGLWVGNCAACGDCKLHLTGGICPIACCSKGLLNGPCGGSKNGKCEIDNEVDCAWQMIYDRLKNSGKLEQLEEIIPIKDWSKSSHGGPGKIIREDVKL